MQTSGARVVPRALAVARALASAASALVLLAPAAAQTQTFPNRAVRMVVPFPAGGGSDLAARRLGERLGNAWKQPVVIQNLGGGAGNVAAGVVAGSEPDGHTIFFVSLAILVVNPMLYGKLPFDADRDFAPVVLLAETPHVLLVGPGVSAQNLRDFIAHARANPGKLNFASGGQGTTLHLAGELLKSVAGLQMQHIPYKGAAPALTALIADEVQMFMDNASSAVGHIRNGRLRGLAVASASRLAILAEVPTFEEAGIANFRTGVPHGIVVRAGVPGATVQTINRAINRVIEEAEFRKQNAAVGTQLIGGTPEQLTAYLAQEKAKWRPLVQKQGIKAF